MSPRLCLRGYSAAWAVISCEIPPCQSEGKNKSQTIGSPASAPGTEHFRPPADVSPPCCPHMLTWFRSLRLGWNPLCSFKCLQMAACGFQRYKSRLFDWPGDDRCCWPGQSLGLRVMTQVKSVVLEMTWCLLSTGAHCTREIQTSLHLIVFQF